MKNKRNNKEISKSIVKGLKQSLKLTRGEKVNGMKTALVDSYKRKTKVKNKIPKFKTEDEERKFWAKHDSSDYLDWSKAKKVSFTKLKPTENMKRKM
jgi:hypothetical protein